jgi:hypothetical protein
LDPSDTERERPRMLIEGGELVPIGTGTDSQGAAPAGADGDQPELPANAGLQGA